MDELELQVRPASAGDYARFLRAFAELHVPDRPPERDAWQREFMPSTLFFDVPPPGAPRPTGDIPPPGAPRPTGDIPPPGAPRPTGDNAGKPLAYAFVETLGDTGYIRHFVIESQARGRGIGHTVMRLLKQRFKERGCRYFCLNVEPQNTPALRLYESAGLRPAYESVALRLGWSAVSKLPDSGPDLQVQFLEPRDDAAAERSFQLQDGLLASRRKRQDVVVMVVRDAGAPQLAGLGCFDPHFSAASPFCARDPGAARMLLEALRPFALDANELQVGIERAPVLAKALRDAGAETRLETVHFRGEL